MAKATTGILKSDQAINNVLRQIRNIKSSEARGEVAQFTTLRKGTNCTQKPEKAKDIKLTQTISQVGRKRLRKTIDKAEAELILLSKEVGVPIEILRKNPNLRPIKK